MTGDEIAPTCPRCFASGASSTCCLGREWRRERDLPSNAVSRLWCIEAARLLGLIDELGGIALATSDAVARARIGEILTSAAAIDWPSDAYSLCGTDDDDEERDG